MDTRQVAARIGDVHAAINHFLADRLRRYGIEGLAPSHGAILHHLYAHGEVSMKELAKAAKRDKSTITALVKKLVAGGYVTTAPDPADQRSVLVALAPRASVLEPAFQEISDILLDTIWNGLDAEAQQAFLRTLQRIQANFL